MNSGRRCVASFIAFHDAQPAIGGYVSVMRIVTPSSAVKLVRHEQLMPPSRPLRDNRSHLQCPPLSWLSGGEGCARAGR
jgi:hypothetical protein